MDAGPLLQYFGKLYKWLVEENKKYNRTVGWKTETEPGKYEITKEHKLGFLNLFILFNFSLISYFNWKGIYIKIHIVWFSKEIW